MPASGFKQRVRGDKRRSPAPNSPSLDGLVVVEVGDALLTRVDRRLVRRLVRLELRELTIPEPYGERSRRPTPAYLRIYEDGAVLSVELWHRGVFEGQRALSGRGNKRLLARRIALVSAELAKALVNRRRRHANNLHQAEARARRVSIQQRGYPIFARWALRSQALVTQLGGDAWLYGSQLGAQLRFDNKMLVELGVSSQMGPTPGLAQAGPIEWLELNLSVARKLVLSRRNALEVGAFLGVARVHFTRTGSALATERSYDDWGARAGMIASYQWAASPWLQLEGSCSGGLLLRNARVAPAARAERLGGAWASLGLGLVLEPTSLR